MAYSKINHTGVHKGNVAIICAFYLSPTDPNYDKCYVQVVDTESEAFKAGYLGKVDEEGIPIDGEDYQAWEDKLPRIWQNMPFHKHCLYFTPDNSDEYIKAKIDEALNYFYNFHRYCWGEAKTFLSEWEKVPRKAGTIRCPIVKNRADAQLCEVKVTDVLSRKDDFDRIAVVEPVDLGIR